VHAKRREGGERGDAVPGIIDLITGSRLAPGDAGAVVAAGSGWLAFGLAYLWGTIKPPRPPSEPP
jgi:hypothetical protein